MAAIVLLGGCRKTPRGQRAPVSPRPQPSDVAVRPDAAVSPAFTLIELEHMPCLLRQCGVFVFRLHGDGRMEFDADPRDGAGVSTDMASARELAGLAAALAEAPPPTPDPGPGHDVPDCGQAMLTVERPAGRELFAYNLCNVPRRALALEKLLAAMRHGRNWRAFLPSQ